MSRKSMDPSSWRSKNAEHLQAAAVTKKATVWFWKHIPDPVIFALGVLFIAPGLPLFALLIGGSEVVWFMMLRVVAAFPFLATLPKMVADLGCKFGEPYMRDKRDAPYFLPTVFLTIYAPTLFLWALYRHVNYGFEVSTLVMYHALRLMPRYRCFAYLHVLLHKEGHTKGGFFKAEWANFGVMHFFTGLFYGAVPYSYPVYHNKIHHAYDNDLDDVHTNLDLDRSEPTAFIYYMPRFALYWSGISCAIKFYQKGQFEFLRKTLMGMAMFYSIWYFLWVRFGALFTIYYAMFPFIECVTFFGGISYLWHAWCDPNDINNPYVDSVTIVDGKDNIFNEDYHVVHHTKPFAHWTEYRQLYEDNIADYQKYNATIFRDCEEGEMLYWLLAGKWDSLAEHMVDLSGKMNHAQKRQLCLDRLRCRLARDDL